jgi:hypothetical protein
MKRNPGLCGHDVIECRLAGEKLCLFDEVLRGGLFHQLLYQNLEAPNLRFHARWGLESERNTESPGRVPKFGKGFLNPG